MFFHKHFSNIVVFWDLLSPSEKEIFVFRKNWAQSTSFLFYLRINI